MAQKSEANPQWRVAYYIALLQHTHVSYFIDMYIVEVKCEWVTLFLTMQYILCCLYLCFVVVVFLGGILIQKQSSNWLMKKNLIYIIAYHM